MSYDLLPSTCSTLKDRAFPDFVRGPLHNAIAGLQRPDYTDQVTIGWTFLHIHPFGAAVLFADNSCFGLRARLVFLHSRKIPGVIIGTQRVQRIQ